MSMKLAASRGDMTAELATCFHLISYLAHSSTLKKEMIYSSKTTVDFKGNTRSYIPADTYIQCDYCANFISNLCIILGFLDITPS
jgi:hypothetical protein